MDKVEVRYGKEKEMGINGSDKGVIVVTVAVEWRGNVMEEEEERRRDRWR